MKINEHGYWEEICNHHTDFGLMKSLIEILSDMNSVVDFGCGDATYAKNIKNILKIYVKAFDGNPNVRKITNNFASQLDLSIPFDLKEKFDAVISLEVAEHIPKKYEDIYVDNLINHTNGYIIISWAIPNQGGKGHVNEQTNEYGINKFKNKKFNYLSKVSEYLRNNIENCNWFKNTIFVFEKL